MVGENQKEELLAKMTKLFSSVSPTKIRYFPSLEVEAAWTWLES
ncbi:MAG: STAS/SEC14 domain-containing protein [Actinomycetia bacterium]|jgi:hypothetical protein|nr:STAS/SEC14 domain-containing protein [Actinomycetes bacterium]